MRSLRPRNNNLEQTSFASLKKLMGEATYYAWLAIKFPNVTSKTLLDKTANENLQILSAEMNTLLIFLQHLDLNKEKAREELLEKFSSREEYLKFMTDQIKQYNLYIQESSKVLVTTAQNVVKDKTLNHLKNFIAAAEVRINNLKVQREILTDSLARIDNVIQKFDLKIKADTESYFEDIRYIASKIPADHPSRKQDIEKLNELEQNFKTKNISLVEFNAETKNIFQKYPHLKQDTNQTDKKVDLITSDQKNVDNLVKIRDEYQNAVATATAEINSLVSQLSLAKSEVSKIESKSNSSEEKKEVKVGGTSFIANMLAKAEEKENLNISENVGFTKSVENFINEVKKASPADAERDALMASLFKDLDDADKALESAPALVSLRTYEQSLKDPPYNPAPEPNPPAYNPRT